MSAWLDDRRDNPVKFPHIPWELEHAVAYQRDRCRLAVGAIRGARPLEMLLLESHAVKSLRFAWRDYRGLMARVGALNANRRKEQT